MSEQHEIIGPPSSANGGNERMLRDMARWKDRVELSLDNRQVFFLFFGGALIACLVFVLGIMVGKRLEARAREQTVAIKSDPLAALDQLAEEKEARSVPAAPAAAKTTSAPPAAPPSIVQPIKSPPPVPAPSTPKPAADKPPRWTLQLSAFQDRAEADEFAKKVSGSGYKVGVVAAEIPGRGLWYRVRAGDFPSQKAAMDAKAEIERKLRLIAYVTKL